MASGSSLPPLRSLGSPGLLSKNPFNIQIHLRRKGNVDIERPGWATNARGKSGGYSYAGPKSDSSESSGASIRQSDSEDGGSTTGEEDESCMNENNITAPTEMDPPETPLRDRYVRHMGDVAWKGRQSKETVDSAVMTVHRGHLILTPEKK